MQNLKTAYSLIILPILSCLSLLTLLCVKAEGRIDTTLSEPIIFNHTGEIRDVIYDSFQELIIISGNNHITLWDMRGNLEGEFLLNESVQGLILKESEPRILTWEGWTSLYMETNLYLWNISENTSLTLPHSSRVVWATWDSSYNRILSWTAGGDVVVWSSQGELLLKLPHAGKFIRYAEWGADENQIISLTTEGDVSVWTNTGELVDQFARGNSTWTVAYDQLNDYILTFNDEAVRFWNNEGMLLRTIPHEGHGLPLLLKDNKYITWTSNRVLISNYETGEILSRIEVEEPIQGVSTNLDSTILALWTYHHLTLWDTQGHLITTIAVDDVHDVQFNPENDYLLTYSNSDIICQQNCQHMVRIYTLNGELADAISYTDTVYGIKWNAQGTLALSWSNDGKAVIWDKLGNETFVYEHEDAVFGATWVGNDSQFLSWLRNDSVYLWNIP